MQKIKLYEYICPSQTLKRSTETDKLRLNQLCFEEGRKHEEGNLFSGKTCHCKTVNNKNELKFAKQLEFFQFV